MRQQTDPIALGINVREYDYSDAELDDLQRYCRSLHTKFSRPALTRSEWLFINRACARFPNGHYLEIGVYRHTSTCAFLRAMETNDALLTTIDVHYRYPYFMHPMESIQGRWLKMVGSSLDWLPRMDGGQFDVIFVDGLHKGYAVEADTRQAVRLRAPGGVVIIHDANSPPLMGAILKVLSPDSIDFMTCHPDHTKGLAVYPKGWPND